MNKDYGKLAAPMNPTDSFAVLVMHLCFIVPCDSYRFTPFDVRWLPDMVIFDFVSTAKSSDISFYSPDFEPSRVTRSQVCCYQGVIFS